MQLPNIPRLTADEKSRFKYISDYERFEPELRRHHIGTAETTNTLGLKDVPADFDRTVPSLSDPTRAEVEFARQHPRRACSAKRHAEGGPSAVSIAAAGIYIAANPTPPSATAATGTKGGSLLFTTPPPRIQQCEGGNDEHRPPSAQKASLDGSSPTVNKELLSVSAAVPLSDVPEVAPSAGVATAGASAAAIAEAAAAKTPVAEKDLAATSRAPRFPAAASPKPSELKKTPADAKMSMSLPQMRSALPFTKLTTAQQHAARSDSKSATSIRRSSARRAQRMYSPPSPTPAPRSTSVVETARLLFVLIEPPPQYVTSLALDFSCFDLGWMRNEAAPPRHLTTIANYSGAAGAANPPAKINSPRSVLTLLEHGASLKDGAMSDTGINNYSSSDPVDAGVGCASAHLRAELQQHRRAHLQEKQKVMREALEKSYAARCSRIPLDELVDCYRQLRRANLHSDAAIDEAEKATLSTAVLQRQERQRRVFETNKMRMLRQIQKAKELQERQVAAERRQRQAEAEAEEERRRKAAEEEMARHLQQERFEARRAEREQREEAVRMELQSRMMQAEARNAERAAARKRQQRALQQEREAQAAERARRVERNTAVLGEQAALQQQRRLEKEKKMEKLRLAREARRAEEQRLQTEKQQRAAQQRDEARQRAALTEEAVRAVALERQTQAEARLQDFYARRREEAVQRAAAEVEHQKRLESARAEAYAKEEQFKTFIREKLQQHEERYQDTRVRQLAEIAWRREAEREEQEDKAYAVLQLQRKAEFHKLQMVVDLLEKRKAADAVIRQRDLVCEQAMRDRERLREERDTLKMQLANSAP
jgi:hypothetical protein